jgi:hypothetical protein
MNLSRYGFFFFFPFFLVRFQILTSLSTIRRGRIKLNAHAACSMSALYMHAVSFNYEIQSFKIYQTK